MTHVDEQQMKMMRHIAAWTIAIALFFTFAMFNHREHGWNVNSRLCLSMAIVEQNSVRIDDFNRSEKFQTDDVAEFNGHCYSDKSIGTSIFAAVPLGILRAYGISLTATDVHYWATLFVSGLSGAALGALLMLYLAALGRQYWDTQSLVGPSFISVSLILGTQLFGHATLLLPYAPAGAALIGAMLLLQTGINNSSLGLGRTFCIGLLLGLVVLFETLWGVAALGVALLTAWHTRRQALKLWTPFAAGGLLGILPFIVYCIGIFGSLTIPYQYERNEMFRQAMSQGFMGTGLPNVTVLWYLTLHPYRGLFFHSPFLLVGICGFWLLMRDKRTATLGIMSIAVCVFYLLFNSGYYMWWGGWSFSPRHLAMVPLLLAPALFAAWSHWKPARYMTIILFIPALVIHFVVVCMDPQWRDLNAFTSLQMLLHPDNGSQLQWLWMRHIWPMFAQGFASGCIAGRSATLMGFGFIWIVSGGIVFLCERKARQLYDVMNKPINTVEGEK